MLIHLNVYSLKIVTDTIGNLFFSKDKKIAKPGDCPAVAIMTTQKPTKIK